MWYAGESRILPFSMEIEKVFSLFYMLFCLPWNTGKYTSRQRVCDPGRAGDMLQDSCQDKIIHFGSCKTLDTDSKSIHKFLEHTGALGVCGFETEINFVESSAFDLILIEMFQQYKDIAMLDKNLRKNYRSFVKRLQFKLIYR